MRDSRAVQAILEIVQQHRPLVIFLFERKCSESVIIHKQRSLGFDKSFSVSSNGREGGLSILQKEKVEIIVQSYSMNPIDIECRLEDSTQWWWLMGFYRHPSMANRHLSWSLLASLGQRSSLSWVCMGDFNEILNVEEQVGGNHRRESQINGLKYPVHACQLTDLSFVCSSYTWTDNRKDEV